jgi:hypothetical protein
METLSAENRAVYDTLSTAAATQHEVAKKEILALIAESVDSAVARSMDSVRSYVNKSVEDMRVYADGVESMLNRSLDELRVQHGLAAEEAEHLPQPPEGDAETGPHGHRGSSIPR